MNSINNIALAEELANALNDQGSQSFYLACAKKHPHKKLRDILKHVLSVPQSEIRRSRGALFNHIVSQLGPAARVATMTAILGISLGTRSVGLAVISHGALIHWHTHSFPGAWSEQKGSTIIERCDAIISQFRIKRVLVKVPPWHHHNPAISTLLRALLKTFQCYGCMVDYKTKEELKRFVPEVQNRDSLLKYVVNRYPALEPEYEREAPLRRPYHTKMFEAVLGAHVAQHHIVYSIRVIKTNMPP